MKRKMNAKNNEIKMPDTINLFQIKPQDKFIKNLVKFLMII